MVFFVADETMLLLLDHSDHRVVYGVCGVLLNLAADMNARGIFFANDCDGIDRLVSVLARWGADDHALADLVLKTFINLRFALLHCP
jgi:hypothetical protein